MDDEYEKLLDWASNVVNNHDPVRLPPEGEPGLGAYELLTLYDPDCTTGMTMDDLLKAFAEAGAVYTKRPVN